MLRVERVISNEEKGDGSSMGKSMRSRSRGPNREPIDDFDVDTTPIHEKTKIYRPVRDLDVVQVIPIQGLKSP